MDSSTTTAVNPSIPGPIKLLKESLLIYKLRFKTLLAILGISLLVGLVFTGIYFVAAALFLTNITPASSLQLLTNPQAIGGMIAVIIFVVLVAMVIQTWISLAMMIAIVGYREKVGFAQAFSSAPKKIIPMVFIGILTGLIFTAGLYMLIIPGIIFGVWFSLSSYVLVAENTGGMTALLKSKAYVKGKFWAVLWRLICLILFFILLYIIFLSLNAVIGSFGDSLAVGIIQGSLVIIFNIVLFLIGPLSLIYMFLIYDHLKASKGNMNFVPSKGSKIIFSIVAILPIVIWIVIFYAAYNITRSIFNPRSSASENYMLDVMKDSMQTTTSTPSSPLNTLTVPDSSQ